MRNRLCSILLSSLFLSMAASAQQLEYVGEGTRQNTTFSTFDSYKMVHYAANLKRELSPQVARSLNLTMLTDFGILFTKDRMVEALEQALTANTSSAEFASLSPEINRFKKTLLALPIGNGTELRFQHTPENGLEILMKGPRGFARVLKSSDQNFSMKVFSIWLGKAHPDANNRGSLERLIEDLWKNAR